MRLHVLFLLVAMMFTPAAWSAEVVRDFSVVVTLDASESSKDGQDWSKTTRKHRYEFTTRLRSDGELSGFNPKDPAELERSMALAGAVQRKVQAAQARAPKPAGPAKSLEQISAEMQKAQAACAGNQQCMMKLAVKMSSPEMQAQMQAAQAAAGAQQCKTQYSDATQQQQCLQAFGVVGVAPAGQDDEALLNAEPEARYLQFVGDAACPQRIKVSIDDRTEGAYADVQGMVPYTIEQKANWSGDAQTQQLLCLSHSPVLDTKSNTLWFDTVGVPTPRVSYIHTERGRSERNDNSEMSLPDGVAEWINETLRNGPASGTRSAVLPLFKSTRNVGKIEGQARLTATWSFK
ncbi:MAG: hypothetical protein ACT4PG_04090 [Panacagrimonas sp.]